MSKQHKPLTADVIYIYDTGSSEYPETVKILMNDGRYMTYRLEVKQPGFVKAMENIRNMVVGYETKK